MELGHPLAVKLVLIVGDSSATHIGSFFGSIEDAALVCAKSFPARLVNFRTGDVESEEVGNSNLALGCNHALDFDVTAKACAHGLHKSSGFCNIYRVGIHHSLV